MRRSRSSLGKSGMTMIELLMASAVFGLIGSLLLMGLNTVFRAERRTRQRTAEDRMVLGILSNVQANLHLFPTSTNQVGSSGAQTEIEQMTDKMPMAFSDSDFVSVDQCPTCPGRFGYVIQPMQGMNSLYLVTLRLKHRDLYGANGIKEYRFLTGR